MADPAPLPLLIFADDQPEVRMLLRLTLRHAGFRVVECGTGSAALDAAQTELPAAMLLDVMMPGTLDGIQACRAVRQLPGGGAVRIVMLSARAQAADIEAGLAAGADAYLTKPFSPLELLTTLYRALGRAVPDAGSLKPLG